jgi:protein-tyrosine phosphatase
LFDIHCHIIPAIDDGVQSIEEALELIRKEVEGGTRGFVATPHVYSEQDLRDSQQIVDKTAALRETVAAEGIEVEIHQGAEVYPAWNVIKAVDDGMPITAGGHRKHILIDLPMGPLPMDFSQLLFELRARSLTPIIAHPERCASFQRTPELLKEFLDNGSVCQINAGSTRGKHGERAQEVAFFYLERHWPHFLASDAHKARPDPILGKVVSRLSSRLDAEYLKIISETSGRCIAHGEDLPTLPKPTHVPEPKKTGWIERLRNRGR